MARNRRGPQGSETDQGHPGGGQGYGEDGAQPQYGPYGAFPPAQPGPGAPPYGPPQPGPYGYGYPYGYFYPPPQQPTNTLAILALVFAFVCAPAAIVLGALARRQIRRTGEQGQGLATAGLVLGIVFTALSVIWVVLLLTLIGHAFSDANQQSGTVGHVLTAALAEVRVHRLLPLGR